MNRWILLICLLFSTCLSLFGAIVWNEPVEVADYSEGNLEFEGTGVKCADGSTVLAWKEGTSTSFHCCLQKFDSQMQPIWNSPVILTSRCFEKMNLVETSDGNIILFWMTFVDPYDWLKMYAQKFDSSGVPLWNTTGVIVVNHFDNSLGYISNFKAVPDLAGGAYLTWSVQMNYDIKLQHINNLGILNMTNAGIYVNDSIDSYNPDIMVMPDNSVLVAYSSSSQIKTKKINSVGAVSWSQTVPQPSLPETGGRPRLISSDPTNFTVIVHAFHRIFAMKYSLEGTAIWQSPTLVCQMSNNEDISIGQQIANPDGTCIITYLVWSGNIYAQKLDTNGALQWGQSGITVAEQTYNFDSLSVVPDESGGCYSVFYEDIYGSNDDNLFVQHISGQGEMLAQPLLVRTVKCQPSRGFPYYITQQDHNVLINWMDYQGSAGGIFAQCVNPQGNELFDANDVIVRALPYGGAQKPVLAARSNDVVAVWLAMDLLDGSSGGYHSWIYYQIVTTDGTLTNPAGGIPLNTNASQQITNVCVNTDLDDNTLITWSVSNCIYGQLLDQNCNQLWEPNGRLITTGTNLELQVSYDNGAFYVVWTSSSAIGIFGQKYVDGTAQWAQSGLQIVTANPSYPSISYSLADYRGRFITFSLTRQFQNGRDGAVYYTVNHDGNGQCSPGFNSYGTQVADVPDYACGQTLSKCMLLQGSLIVIFNSVRYIPEMEEYEYDLMAQKLDAFGFQEWGSNGTAWYEENANFVFDSSIYTASLFNSMIFIEEMDSNHHTIWGSGIHVSWTAIDMIELIKISAQCILVTARVTNDSVTNLVHFYYYSGRYFFPADFVVADGNHLLKKSTVRVGNQAMLMYTYGDIGSGDGYSSIYMQLLNNGDVGIDDENAPPSPAQDLLSNYPNPFNQKTTIAFDLQTDTFCDVVIYNSKGQVVRKLHSGLLAKGRNKIEWDGTDDAGKIAANGVYLYRLSDGKHSSTRRLCLLRS